MKGRLRVARLVSLTVVMTACTSMAVETGPTSTPAATATSLPPLQFVGYSISPAGLYGFTGALGEGRWMHYVIDNPTVAGEYGEIQMVFIVQDDCFPGAQASELTPTTIAGYDALYLEPYDDGPESLPFQSRRKTFEDTTAAHALHIGDRTLCVYLNWRSNVSEAELSTSGARDAISSIQAEPFGENGLRVVFELRSGWDRG